MGRLCNTCGEIVDDHDTRNCPHKGARKCSSCGFRGHNIQTCPKEKAKKDNERKAYSSGHSAGEYTGEQKGIQQTEEKFKKIGTISTIVTAIIGGLLDLTMDMVANGGRLPANFFFSPMIGILAGAAIGFALGVVLNLIFNNKK